MICFTDGPDNIQVLGPNEVYFGQIVELECCTESKPPASYSWELNGKEIHSSSVFTKVISEFSNTGNYTCRATNNITGRASIAVHRLSAAGTNLVIVGTFVHTLGTFSPELQRVISQIYDYDCGFFFLRRPFTILHV